VQIEITATHGRKMREAYMQAAGSFWGDSDKMGRCGRYGIAYARKSDSCCRSGPNGYKNGEERHLSRNIRFAIREQAMLLPPMCSSLDVDLTWRRLSDELKFLPVRYPC
jgi:hypothetical protein